MEQYKKIGSLTGILSDHLWIVRLVIIVVGIKYNNIILVTSGVYLVWDLKRQSRLE